jgi:hypothetical protein
MKLYITDKADREWPSDHPARKGTEVMAVETIDALPNKKLIIVSRYGEPRELLLDGDEDIEAKCGRCEHAVLIRRPGPRFDEVICLQCFTEDRRR